MPRPVVPTLDIDLLSAFLVGGITSTLVRENREFSKCCPSSEFRLTFFTQLINGMIEEKHITPSFGP